MSLKSQLIAPLVIGALALPATAEESKPTTTTEEPLAQIALLLDTSGSMEGLIDQARCQLWNAVSELSKASRDGAASKLEIAVYQYGSETLPADTGFIRQVTGFTDNLDTVSRALFSLHARGSEEFCGQVIDQALTELPWNSGPGVYKAVFIAGNESFDQGHVTFGQALPKALNGDITVNSIYCFVPTPTKKGTASKSIPRGASAGMEQWEAAAKLTGGLYFQIDHNHHLPQMETPFDSRMRELNEEMNATFVWHGEGSQHAAANQKVQDENAAKMSDHAFAARMSAKIGHLYHHAHHDLIDAINHGKVDLATMPEAKMPEDLQKMTPQQRVSFVEDKVAARDGIRRQMADVIAKRHAFLERKMAEKLGKEDKTMTVLGDALVNAVRSQTIRKGFEFDQNSAPQASNNP